MIFYTAVGKGGKTLEGLWYGLGSRKNHSEMETMIWAALTWVW